MEGIDPDVLLEWLQTGMGDERDLQLMALEQLCMLLLMADNIDRCFESCPPRTFLPALCKIFLDESAPENILEVTARAITYYLDVSNECTRRITQVDGAVKAICNRLAAAEMNERASKDLAEQCVKLLEHVCQRETLAVYDAGGMNAMLTLVRAHGEKIHKDTMHSAMSVVTRLCGKMEPSDTDLPQCAESLGILLCHEDAKVSESALRCFAALTDRFIRKMMDPAELAKHSNLVEHLLTSVSNTAGQQSTSFVSIVLSLLSNLCRGSATVTEQVLSSPHLMTAIHSVLTNKDDRVVTDGLRLADLLVVLLCEGRSSLPYTVVSAGEAASSGGNAERAHRHLIDAIRQKDLNALVEAIEQGAVDVNFTDDVGQTLCNWASAFGSIEMVQYLCDKGADVNKGNKSSSLHYAACFGRPDIVKLLLQRGANPDLRDEDGKTALDKARERSDEDHTQVAAILESPTVYMHSHDKPGKSEASSIPPRKMSMSELPDRELASQVLQQLLPIFCEIFQKSLSASVRRTSLSLLRKIVEHMQAENLRSASRCSNSTSPSIPEGAESLVAVVVSVLDQEEDYDGQEQVMLILASLLRKDPELWVGEMVRLGVFERVEAMAKEPPPTFDEDVDEHDKAEELNSRNLAASRSTTSTPSVNLELEADRASAASGTSDDRDRERAAMLNITMESDDLSSTETPPPTLEMVGDAVSATASSLVSSLTHVLMPSKDKENKKDKQPLHMGIPYRWKEWRLTRWEESLFIWNDILAMEFSFTSNGWFRYMSDGEVRLMFTNGTTDTLSPDGRMDAKKGFMSRWRKAKSLWPEDHIPVAALGLPSPSKKLEVPQWEILCPRPAELLVRCSRSDGVLTIRDEVGGFNYEAPDKTKHPHLPETTLSPEFHTGWCNGVSPRRAKFRNDIQRRKVQELAWDLWINHLKEACAKPREALIELETAAKVIDMTVNHYQHTGHSVKSKHVNQPRIEKVQELLAALRVVRESVVDERRLSTFEFSVSGVVPAMHQLLSLCEKAPTSYPARIFKEAFSQGTALTSLVLKMVAVLEANEKFPQYLYDTPGGSAYGLQLLQRRIRMKLELSENLEKGELMNRSGKVIKSEPLTSIGQLKGFLMKMVAKQWFDRERGAITFVQKIQELKKNSEVVKCIYASDFDQEGVIYWLGTNGKTTEWSNPATINVVSVESNDQLPFGKPEDILSRDPTPVNCHTLDEINSNFTIDLGVQLYPTAYTLRHSRGYGRSALRSWFLQGSKDKQVWELLVAHSDDTSLNDPGSTATWPIEDDRTRGPYRYFRIAQNGRNSSELTHFISCSGFEIYGDIVDVITEELPKKPPPTQGSGEDKPASSHKTRKEEKKNAVIQQAFQRLPQGGNNNRIKLGCLPESSSSSRMKHRMRGHQPDIRGTRVVRGNDWRWDDQDGHGEGRIISNPENGWVDVMWTNNYTNSYRYGLDGRFDVRRADDMSVPLVTPTSSVLESMRNRSRNIMNRTPSRDSPFAALSFTFGKGRKNAPPSTPLSRFGAPSKGVAGTTGPSSSGTSTSIGKKSMSTTNLVEDRSKQGPSVASTGQAASAESLQHQTASLENLLARANTHYFGRIAETSESAETPEPGRETPVADGESETTSAQSSNAALSICSSQSSVVAGGNTTDETTPSTPQGDSKLNSLSVSAPDLAAVRQRQQSSDVNEAEKVDEEDDQDEEEDEDVETDDEAEKLFATMMVDAFSSSSSHVLDRLRDLLPEEPMEALLVSTTADHEAEASSAFAARIRASTSSDSSSTKERKKDRTAILKAKLGSYAEVLRGLVSTFSDHGALDVEELLDEEDYYDDDENEGDIDMADEFGADTLAHMLGQTGERPQLKLSWKQLTQLMGAGGFESTRLRDSRPPGSGSGKNLRSWDDELVLKCSFQALIPAFDPRPGRTNVNQIQEVELPAVVLDQSEKDADTTPQKLRLFLRGPNINGVENVTIEMTNNEESIFRYVQEIISLIDWGAKCERNRRVWEPTYTLIYEQADAPSTVQAKPIPSEESQVPVIVSEALEVIRLLSTVVERLPDAQINTQVFISDKITLKITQELSDALVVAARALPHWCEKLIYTYPCLFSVETRNMYLNATAFGVSRSIVWLQQKRDAVLDRTRHSTPSAVSSVSRGDRYQEFRIGRLKHERIKVARAEEMLLEQAMRLMRFHADRKAVLEIEYHSEEGTGLGPTLEFYALVAAELQRKGLAIWLCDDMDDNQLKMEERELDLGEGKKPPGFYVRRPGGLFPAPLPPHSEETRRASEIFRTLGIYLAKVLQDGRLVDLPLSHPFLKMVVSPQLSETVEPSLDRVLNLDDFEQVHPVKGGFLKELRALAQRKRVIENDTALDREAKRRKIDQLKLCIHGTRCSVEELALTFTVNPPSKVFEYEEMELVEGGSDMDVTMDNVEIYVQKCADFYLNSGILEQMKAFREGFDRVFPLKSLRSYSSDEIQRLISGEQCPVWTREEVMNYTEPKLGYTKESPGFLRFVDVMVEMNAQERKNFLQFATGCSSLPPGGLANLHPRLTVVRRVESGDGSYPSVNTCVHYLKLPEYSSSEILRERLLTAINEKGFHLN